MHIAGSLGRGWVCTTATLGAFLDGPALKTNRLRNEKNLAEGRIREVGLMWWVYALPTQTNLLMCNREVGAGYFRYAACRLFRIVRSSLEV
jgi:hypothetical protein